MAMVFRIIGLFLISFSLWANSATSPWYNETTDKKIVLHVTLFLSSTCPYCYKADAFFRDIESKTPWLHVTRSIIDQDKESLIQFNRLLTEQNSTDFSVPSVFFCNSRWAGFASSETTGKDLLHAMSYCKQQIEQKGELAETTTKVLKRWSNANIFDSNIVGNPTALQFVTMIALMDAYNPCSLFAMAGFLAFLFLQNTRKKQLLSGGVFTLCWGLMHYLQQAYANLFFEMLPWFRGLAVCTGLFSFYVIGSYYRKNVLHYVFLLLVLMAIMIGAYQQLCLMNWAYIFEQWLNNQHFSNAQIGIYQLVYQLLYLAPLIFTMLVYVLLIQAKFFARFSERLKTIGLLYIFAIGLLLLVYPYALSNLILSLFVLFTLFISGWILSRYKNN